VSVAGAARLQDRPSAQSGLLPVMYRRAICMASNAFVSRHNTVQGLPE